MPYDNITDAGNLGKLIPEETVSEILKNVPQQSASMTLFRRVPLATRVVRQNVMTALPQAYFVNGDTGLKQTTEMAWGDVAFQVEEIATILPIPQNVADDVEFDIWGEARPLVEEAFGRVIDNAIFFGVGKPASWPAAIVPGAVAAGNNVDIGASGQPPAADWGTVFDDSLSDLMTKVEEDGFGVTGFVIPRTLMGRFRKARNVQGERIFDSANLTFEGVQMRLAMDGLWPTGANRAEIVAGDFTKGLIGVRKDVTFEMFREGIIQDNTGAIIFNLMQQDMVAMRVTMRLAWVTANPIHYANMNAATRYPFAVLRNTVA